MVLPLLTGGEPLGLTSAGYAALAEGAGYARPSIAWDVDGDGALTPFPAGMVRQGETLVNQLRNPRFEGAQTVAEAGGAGVHPTTVSGLLGLKSAVTAALVGRGIDADGYSYLDVSLTGTCSGGGQVFIGSMDNGLVAPASAGQTWTGAIDLQRVGGTTANAVIILELRPADSAGVALSGSSATVVPTTAMARYAHTGAPSAVGIAYMKFNYRVGIADGVTYDETYRIRSPQLERGDYASPLTLPPVGVQRVSYRDASRLTTNLVTNPRGVGAALGVIGSGGALPANFVGPSTTAGVATQIVGTGTTDGVPWVDYRCFGTTTAIWLPNFVVENTTTIAASVGQTWTASAWVQITAGVWPLGSLVLGLGQHTGATFVATTNGPNFIASSAAWARQTFTLALATGGIDNIRPRIWGNANVASGVAVDFTIRIGGSQCERSATVGNLALPAAGTTGISYIPTPLAPVGPLLEAAQTNLLTNPHAIGGETPGAIPTGWGISAVDASITTTWSGQTVINGVTCQLIRLQATVAMVASSAGRIQLGNTVNATAALGLSLSAFVAIVAGDMTGLTAINLRLAGASPNPQRAQAVDGTLRRFAESFAYAADAASQIPQLTLIGIPGSLLDITLAIGAPNLTEGRIIGSPVLPSPPAIATSTRAADDLEATGAAFDRIFPLRDERTNLLPYSSDFNTWSKGTSTVTNDGTLAPDGSAGAFLITSTQEIGVNRSISVAAGVAHTVSYYARAGTATQLRLRDAGATDISVFFTFATQMMTATASPNLLAFGSEALPNGWHRVWYTCLAAGSLLQNPRPTDAGTTTFYLWRAMVEVAPALPAPNLLTSPEEFDTAAWVKTASTVASNVASPIAPDGTASADRIEETATVSAHGLVSTLGVMTPGASYTLSIYARAAERNWFRLAAANGFGAGASSAFFNLATGTLGVIDLGGSSAGGHTIVDAGDGWMRCSLTFTAGSAIAAVAYLRLQTADSEFNYSGVAGHGLHVWGANFLEAAAPPDYVPLSALVSPSIETAAVAASRFVGATLQGCIICDVKLPVAGPLLPLYAALWELGDGSYRHRTILRLPDGTTTPQLVSTREGMALYSSAPAGAMAPDTLARVGVRWDEHGYDLTLNGVGAFGRLACKPPVVDLLQLGNVFDLGLGLSGRLPGFWVHRRRPNDARFRAASTPGANVAGILGA